MGQEEELSESLEDYLETILELQSINKVARSKDIATKMNIKRGSVTGMLKKLAAKEFINYEPYGYVTLTAKGEKIAKEIENRHLVLKDFFLKFVKFSEQEADETACRMEHTMNKKTFEKFKKFIKSIKAG